jgi:hypothetical protein
MNSSFSGAEGYQHPNQWAPAQQLQVRTLDTRAGELGFGRYRDLQKKLLEQNPATSARRRLRPNRVLNHLGQPNSPGGVKAEPLSVLELLIGSKLYNIRIR